MRPCGLLRVGVAVERQAGIQYALERRRSISPLLTKESFRIIVEERRRTVEVRGLPPFRQVRERMGYPATHPVEFSRLGFALCLSFVRPC